MFFCWNLNIHLGFPICQPTSSSQGFKRTHQDPRALMLILFAAYPLARPRSFFLLHVLWPDRDPSSCCTSSGLIAILFFFLYYYYYYFFLFPSFWDFRLSWSLLTSWIGSSFVKAYSLSLLFMEWAINTPFLIGTPEEKPTIRSHPGQEVGKSLA